MVWKRKLQYVAFSRDHFWQFQRSVFFFRLSFQTSGVESSPHNMPQHDRIRNYNHQSPLTTHRQRTVSGWRMRNFRNQDGSCLTLGWSQSPSSQLGWCKLGRFWHPNSESVGFQSLQGVTRECTPRKSGVLEPCWNLSLLGCKAGLMFLILFLLDIGSSHAQMVLRWRTSPGTRTWGSWNSTQRFGQLGMDQTRKRLHSAINLDFVRGFPSHVSWNRWE